MKLIISFLMLLVWFINVGIVQAEIKWSGVTQITIDSDDFIVKPKRVRLGYSWRGDGYFSRLQVDLQQADGRKLAINESSDIVLDAYIGYNFSKTLSLKVGAFPMPVGMDFLTSIKKLDIAERGADAKLVLNRAVGVMLSNSHNLWNSKWSYDIAVAGPASRLSLVESPGKDATSVAIRLAFDKGGFHYEASTGINEDVDRSAIVINNVGLSYKWANWTLKTEGTYVQLSTSSGDPASSPEPKGTTSFTVVYHFNDKWSAVLKPYVSERRTESRENQILHNIYYGVNYIASKNILIRANYIAASGKNKDDWSDFGGHKNNTALVLLQYAF